MGRILVSLLAFLVFFGMAEPGATQTLGVPVSPILTINSDRLFSESMFGERVRLEIEAEESILRAENRQMEAQLVEEEKQLTSKRKDMTPEDFRAVANAFDMRVEEIRKFQEKKASEISQLRESQEISFVSAARPVLEALMRETSASVILEQRTILMSTSMVDITDEAISRLNVAIGDGTQLLDGQP